MKFLLDMPVPPGLVDWLAGRGHEAVHASALGLGQASDRDLLARAKDEGRILITADTDFPQLLALSQADMPGVILFRPGNYGREELEQLMDRVLRQVLESTLSRAVCVVDRARIRCRLLPLT